MAEKKKSDTMDRAQLIEALTKSRAYQDKLREKIKYHGEKFAEEYLYLLNVALPKKYAEIAREYEKVRAMLPPSERERFPPPRFPWKFRDKDDSDEKRADKDAQVSEVIEDKPV